MLHYSFCFITVLVTIISDSLTQKFKLILKVFGLHFLTVEVEKPIQALRYDDSIFEGLNEKNNNQLS